MMSEPFKVGDQVVHKKYPTTRGEVELVHPKATMRIRLPGFIGLRAVVFVDDCKLVEPLKENKG